MTRPNPGLTKRILKQAPHWLNSVLVADQCRPGAKKGDAESGVLRALKWIRAHELPTGGIRVETGHPNAYPEVSGYIIPTLLKCGDKEFAARLTRWLLCGQRADGSFPDPDGGKSYVFDTGQVLRGLLVATTPELVPGSREAMRRTVDYLMAQMLEKGSKGFPPCYNRPNIPESVHLYVLPPLVEAAALLQDQQVRESALRCLEHYIRGADFLREEDLTHFLAYELEALIDLDRAELAQPVLDHLREAQKSDGSVRGLGGVDWVCTPGLAQLAICWYKLGQWQPADKALSWLESRQESTGGFKGSYGPGAAYKQEVEVSWAPKFYLDAHFLRVAAFFERHAKEFPTTVHATDGRTEAILRLVKNGDKVLEVGCGKGRFLAAVKAAFPSAECIGVDPSLPLQDCLPPGIQGLRGALEAIPWPDSSFDLVFSVEAIEHSLNHERAVEEMVRVTKPGGWVIIIDKQQAHWGRLDCPSWEQWPEISTFKRLLSRFCDDVSAPCVAYDNHPSTDGLMVAWRGRKRSRLSGAQWNTVLISPDLERSIVEAVRSNRFSDWGKAILLQTQPGEMVLEIGSGTGQVSLQLAQTGRVVTCLDTSNDSLAFTQRCARQLELPIQTQCADATQRLPFENRQFDCAWSSGLLEHFYEEERRAMLREWARVCRGKLINLVPNAACLCYRLGKRSQELKGCWPYGLEMPLHSLRADYEAAGVRVVEEFSIGTRHALKFLATEEPQLKQLLTAALRNVPDSELEDWNQGYLLVTVGYCDER